MIWFILIAIVVYVLFRFVRDLNKDNHDLRDKPLSAKFSVIVGIINDAAFNGLGQVTTLTSRDFNLYKDGSNQIIHFLYSTGHLTITWKYKYFQKEVVHEEFIRDVRNLSLFEQQGIGKQVVENAQRVIEKHKAQVTSIADISSTSEILKHLLVNDTEDKDESEINRSMERLAENMNCSVDNVKEEYLKQLKNGEVVNHDRESIMTLMDSLRNEKANEARTFGIRPENTISGLLYNWTEEYFNETEKRVNKIKEIFDRNLRIEQYFLIAEENLINGKIYEANIYTHVGIVKYRKNKTGLREILLKCHDTLEGFNKGFIAILELEVFRTNDSDLIDELGEIQDELDNKSSVDDLPF